MKKLKEKNENYNQQFTRPQNNIITQPMISILSTELPSQ